MPNKDGNSVLDGKLTDEQIGKLDRLKNELIRRINEKTLGYEEVIEMLQVTIEGKHKQFLNVLRGIHKIVAIEHAVNCDIAPFVPADLSVESHPVGIGVVTLEKRADGQLYIDGKKVILYLSKKQINGNVIPGDNLREELSGKKILNANILDYLLAHPELIPEDWKGRIIFFWGTIYRQPHGSLYVRFLCLGQTEWYWGIYWLGIYCDGNHPAAALVS